MNRREALQALSAAAGLATLGGTRQALAGDPALMITRPGLQLYTVRSEMEKGIEATLERVASIGYREVEFAGYYRKTPAEIAALLKANGLTAPAAHVARETLAAGWSKTLDDAAAAGHRYVVVPFIAPAERTSVDTYKRLAAEFNRGADAAKRRGLIFAYHNHDFEFAALAGDTFGHQVLLKECDPALVHFELDLYWISKAGRDPVSYVGEHPGRFPLVHVKDMMADGSMTEVGAGAIPFQRVFDQAKGTIRHFFVEHDNPRSPFESITRSVEALKRLTA
jgi:sugar phosphate isomerase/epimerase